MENKIQQLRRQAGLSQEAFGKKIFVCRQTISNWERGITQPDLASLERMAKTFELPLSYFSSANETLTQQILSPKQKLSQYYYLLTCLSFFIPLGPALLFSAVKNREIPASYRYLVQILNFSQLIIVTGLFYLLIERSSV